MKGRMMKISTGRQLGQYSTVQYITVSTCTIGRLSAHPDDYNNMEVDVMIIVPNKP
jgi:hypothetical protein